MEARPSQYDGLYLRVEQIKTGAVVEVLCTGPLKAALDAEIGRRKAGGVRPLRDDRPFCLRAWGAEWTEDALGDTWRKRVRNKIGAEHLQLRDLRRTLIDEIADTGVEDLDIASVSGHTPGNISRMLGVYTVRNRKRSARAITKVEEARAQESDASDSSAPVPPRDGAENPRK